MKKSKHKKAKLAGRKPQKAKTGFVPLGDKVLIKPHKPDEVTSFGIILPDSAKEKPEQGTVVAVGPGRRSERGERMPMDVKVGDRVFFKKPWDEPVKLDGVEYYIISESDITVIQK